MEKFRRLEIIHDPTNIAMSDGASILFFRLQTTDDNYGFNVFINVPLNESLVDYYFRKAAEAIKAEIAHKEEQNVKKP